MPKLMILAAQSAPTISNAVASDGSFCLARSFVGDHAGGDNGNEGVEHDDQSHAHADAQRNVLLRINGFFGGGGDHIEAEEREEHERGSGDDAATP